VLIEGKLVLKVPIQKAWDYLLRPETLASCIPGCEKMEAINENTYESIVGAQVGPISARFKFTIRFIEVNPPRHLKAIGGGEELNKAGTFSQETVVDLKEVSEGEVEVSYSSDIAIVGRLATFGDRILRAKAKQVGDEFTQALNKRLSGEEATTSKVKVSIWEMLAASLAVFWGRTKKVFKG